MSTSKARTIRRIYLISSLSLGVLAPLFCWYMIPDFNPIHRPLSYFGVAELTFWYWNISVLLIATGLFVNAYRSIPIYFSDKKQKTFLEVLLSISFISLCGVALISMDNYLIHHVAAYTFFLVYNFFIFSFGFIRSLKYVRRGIFSITIGILMLLSSLLLLPFPSYGVFEIVYFFLLFLWNTHLFYKRIEFEDRILKKKEPLRLT
ncbi:MAG: DUF998 domain-containing protein [Flavobacteriales bacterium]|jgi:hypothetical protein